MYVVRMIVYCALCIVCTILFILSLSPIHFYRQGYQRTEGGSDYNSFERSETFQIGDYFCDWKRTFRRLEADDNVTAILKKLDEKSIVDALELPDGTKVGGRLRDIGRCRFLIQEMEDSLLETYGINRDSCRCRYEISMILTLVVSVISFLAAVCSLVEIVIYIDRKVEPTSIYLHNSYTIVECLLWLTCSVILVMRINRSDYGMHFPPPFGKMIGYYYATPGKLIVLPFLTSSAFLINLILLLLWSIKSYENHCDRKLDEYLFERRYSGMKRHDDSSPISSSSSWSENRSRTRGYQCIEDVSSRTGRILRCDRHDYHRFTSSWPTSPQV